MAARHALRFKHAVNEGFIKCCCRSGLVAQSLEVERLRIA